MVENTPKANAPSWAFITPSYSGDYRRCLLLCRSMDTFLSGQWKHYVVVDRPDFEMFKHLEGPRRHVMLTEDVLPDKMKLLFHLPFASGRSVWWSKTSGLSLGWHLQQMVKISIASYLTEDGLAYCDSDTFFVRPFDVAQLTQNQKFRLLRTAQAFKIHEAPNPSFTRATVDMLGLPMDGLYHGYVDNFVTWRRKTVLALQEHLGRKHQGKWRKAFRNRLNVSEYNLYGIFVDTIIASTEAHFHTSEHLCRTHWSREPMTSDQVAQFFRELDTFYVMVGIQSFAKVDLELLEQQFELAVKQAKAA